MKERNWQLDYLKALAMIGVIITHTTMSQEARGNLLYPYFVTMAVPVFMVVSGYTNALAWERKSDTLKTYFKPDRMIRKLFSLYMPFLLILILQCVIRMGIYRNEMGMKDILYGVIVGGWGPGSYYIPVLIQLVFCFPFCYLLIRRFKIVGAVSVICLQIGFEYLIQSTGISEDIYRLLFFRYLVFVVLGMMLYQYRGRYDRETQADKKITGQMGWIALICGGLGAIYIGMVAYAGYVPDLFRYWTDTSMPTVLWTYLLVWLALHVMKRLPGAADACITGIGRSSYEIYLIQMTYFITGIDQKIPFTGFRILCNIVLCVSMGILFRRGISVLNVLNKKK